MQQAAPIYIGIEIGGTKLQLMAGTAYPHIVETLRYDIDVSKGAAGIQQQIATGIEQLTKQYDVAAIGVGFGGPVDEQTGIIQLSHQVSGWQQFNLKQWLEELTHKPVAVDNDANVAALGEALYGSGKSYRNVFYMTIGSGIGGGLVVDGNIYHGHVPGEVEVGHIKLDKKGNTLESKCSGWAVNKKIRNFIWQNPASLLAQLAKKRNAPEAALLKPALEKEDEYARQIINDIADDMAFALSHVVHLFHPQVIIMGGGLSLLHEHLRMPVANRLAHYVMKAFLPPPPVYMAALGEKVVPAGALELAKKAIRD